MDTGFAVVRFASGAIGNISFTEAIHAHSLRVGTVHGSAGTMKLPGPRSGTAGAVITLEGHTGEISGDDLLPLAPADFKLDDITATFFGGADPFASYDMDFEQADRTLLAIEYEEFAQAAQTGEPPEVNAQVGMKALGLSYAILESGEIGEPVGLSDVLEGRVAEYQRSIDEDNNV